MTEKTVELIGITIAFLTIVVSLTILTVLDLKYSRKRDKQLKELFEMLAGKSTKSQTW